MAITVVCPSCGRKLRVADDLNGRRVRCPECETPLTVSVAVAQVDDPEDVAFTKLPAQRNVPAGRPAAKRETNDDDGDGMTAIHYEPPLTPSRAALGFGLAALVIGVLALPLSWVPDVGKLAVPVSGFGLVLGILGVLLAAVRKGYGLTFPLAGLLVSLLAFGLAGAHKLGLLGREPVAKAPPSIALEEPPPKEEAKGTMPPVKEAAPPTVTWFDARKPITVGDVRLQIVGLSVAPYSFDSIVDGKGVSPDKYLLLHVRIENIGKTRKIDYTGWAQGISNAASLTDNFGNTYKRVTPEFGSKITGPVAQVEATTSIYPGNQLDDLLVFEPPLKDAQYLRLVLPAPALGGTGNFHIQIPLAR
jgi:hypothetical protein